MSATVKHGRRAGNSRGYPYNPYYENLPRCNTPKMEMTGHQIGGSAGPDLRKVTVLSKGDWDRIQYQLNKRVIEQERIQKIRDEKERMQKLSKEQVKNWTSTIAGQRLQKLQARKIREEKEEEEKKLMDIEEAKYQAEKRKEAIERAKTQQYYQTDRVKGFHSALLLTEVLKEREAQIELKKLQASVGGERDKMYMEMERQMYEESILRDQEEAREKMKGTKNTAHFQKLQMQEHMKAHQKTKEEDKIEGEELKRLAAQYELEKKRLDEIRHGEARQLFVDNMKQIDDVKKMQKINQMQEEEEDEECRVFAAAKRRMMRLRAEKEKQLQKDKLDKLDRIREKLTAQMQQKADDEDDRIRRALEETRAKQEKEEAEKEAKMRKTFKEIEDQRLEHMKEKDLKAAEERKEALEALLVKKEADALFKRNEEEKRRRKLEENMGVQKFQVQQMGEREKNEQLEKDKLLALDKKNDELMRMEEDQFQEYAKKVIDHAEKGGRNTLPLRRAAKEGAGGGLGPVLPGKGGVRPSYMVADQTGVQLPSWKSDGVEQTKHLIQGSGDTNKRLGFVW